MNPFVRFGLLIVILVLKFPRPVDPEEVSGFRAIITTQGEGELKHFPSNIPVVHSVRELDHLRAGDILVIQPGHRPTSSFCYKNMEILKYLFQLLLGGDRELRRVFFAWVRDRGAADLREEAPALCD